MVSYNSFKQKKTILKGAIKIIDSGDKYIRQKQEEKKYTQRDEEIVSSSLIITYIFLM